MIPSVVYISNTGLGKSAPHRAPWVFAGQIRVPRRFEAWTLIGGVRVDLVHIDKSAHSGQAASVASRK